MPHLCLYPKDSKPAECGNVRASMSIAALLTIAKSQSQPRQPSTAEQTEKMWFTYTIEFFSTITKNRVMLFL